MTLSTNAVMHPSCAMDRLISMDGQVQNVNPMASDSKIQQGLYTHTQVHYHSMKSMFNNTGKEHLKFTFCHVICSGVIPQCSL